MKLEDEFWAALDIIADHESGQQYDRWNPNDVGAGVSVGYIQFNQKYGLLPAVLIESSKMYKDQFEEAFKPDEDKFKDKDWIRNADLNDPSNKKKIQDWFGTEQGMDAQDEVAYRYIWEPMVQYLEQHGKDLTFDWLVLAFSLAIQFAPNTWKKFVRNSDTPQDLIEQVRSYKSGHARRYEKLLKEAKQEME